MMFRIDLKKTIAVLLAVTVMVAAGCSSFRFRKNDMNSKEDIRDIIDNSFDAIVSRNKRTYLSYCLDPNSERTSRLFDNYILFKIYGEDMTTIAKNTLMTTNLILDQDSIEIEDNKATVECSVTMVDFGKILNYGEFKTVGELASAIKAPNADVKKTNLTLNLEYKNDYWYISSQDELVETICIWKDVKEEDVLDAFVHETEPSVIETEPADNSATLAEYASAVTSVNWYDCGEYYKDTHDYVNTVGIECELLIDHDSDLDWSLVSCEIMHNSKIIGTYALSELKKNDETYLVNSLTALDDMAPVSSGKYLKKGTYKFTYKIGEEAFYSCSCQCSNINKGFDMSFEEGDSRLLSAVSFFDWYYAYKEILEFDIFLRDINREMVVAYVLLDSEGNIIYEDSIEQKGLFASIVIYPKSCLLNEFEGEYTLECYDEDEALICSSTINVVTSYSEGV